jgi:hypothetical protein
MKKVLFSIAIVAAVIAMASCGNKSGNSAEEAAIKADTLTFDEYKWFTWTAFVPQQKGYQITQQLPEAVKDFHYSSDITYLVGDKVMVAVEDFDSKTLDEWKAKVSAPDYSGTIDGFTDDNIAGRKALRYELKVGGSTLQLIGYGYLVDFSDNQDGGYKCFWLRVYPADGQPEKIAELLKDEEVKFILDNMKVTPKNE